MQISSIKTLVMRFSKPLTAAGILIIGILGFNVLVATKPEISVRPRLEEVKKISAAQVAIVSAQPEHRAFGTVKAARTADLRFAISGVLASVHPDMKNGMVVAKGEVLARLDTELLELAHQDIEVQIAAEKINQDALAIQLELRQKQFDRVSEMAAAAVASEKSLDDARLALSVSKNAYEQSKSRLKQLQTGLKRSLRNLRDAQLTVPFDGVLSNIIIGEGRVLSSANVLGMITDLSSLEVSFVVPAEIYAASADLIGRPVKVTWKAGGRDVNSAAATISRAEGNVDASEGGGRLYAILSRDDGQVLPKIPAGAFVEIAYPSRQLDEIIILPESALFDRDTVYAVVDGRAAMRKVEVVSKIDGAIYLRGDLNDGDIVITTRLPGLGEGTLVEVVGLVQVAGS
jgi:RND family efflux transporter MFP subunit